MLYVGLMINFNLTVCSGKYVCIGHESQRGQACISYGRLSLDDRMKLTTKNTVNMYLSSDILQRSSIDLFIESLDSLGLAFCVVEWVTKRKASQVSCYQHLPQLNYLQLSQYRPHHLNCHYHYLRVSSPQL